jgi:DNA-binding transcriptional LysR family regulator
MVARVDVAVLSLTEPALSRDITMAWRADRRQSPAAAEFIELARETYSGLGTPDAQPVLAG